MKHDVSVIVTTYRRRQHLEEILSGWADQADEVILANGGQYFKIDVPIRQILFTPDPGNRIRFIAGYMARHKYIIMADDDVIPLPGLVNEMIKKYLSSNFSFVGLYGMDFLYPEFMRNPNIRADQISESYVRTDYVGVVYLCSKRILFRGKFDPMNIPHKSVDDLYFQCEINGELKKGVLKTDLYKDLSFPRSDDGAICRDEECKNFRWNYSKKFNNWRNNGR